MKKPINAIVLLIGFNVVGQTLESNLDCAIKPPDFSKLSYEEGSKAVDIEDSLIVAQRIKKICPEYISNLVTQLQHGRLSEDKKTLAIYLLGELRPSDTNCIEVLIENIDLKATKLEPPDRISRWSEYPAEGALMKIGMPVVNPILQHLLTETNELRRHLMCKVLKQVEGKGTAQSQIKQKLADEAAKRTNLEAALKELEK